MIFIGKIKKMFFPARCCGCDSVVRAGFLCDDCRKKLVHPSDEKSRCDVCFLPADECICGSHLYYDAAAFLFYNEGAARKTLYGFKFSGRKDHARSYAQLLARALDERGLAGKFSLITAIPMTPDAVSRRGYNQAELIAAGLSEITGIEYVPLLYKCLDSARQHDLNRIERTGNIEGAFEPFEKSEALIDGADILVVDDIITGGSTVNEAAKTLKIFGAENVYVAVAAATKKYKTKRNKEKPTV